MIFMAYKIAKIGMTLSSTCDFLVQYIENQEKLVNTLEKHPKSNNLLGQGYTRWEIIKKLPKYTFDNLIIPVSLLTVQTIFVNVLVSRLMGPNTPRSDHPTDQTNTTGSTPSPSSCVAASPDGVNTTTHDSVYFSDVDNMIFYGRMLSLTHDNVFESTQNTLIPNTTRESKIRTLEDFTNDFRYSNNNKAFMLYHLLLTILKCTDKDDFYNCLGIPVAEIPTIRVQLTEYLLKLDSGQPVIVQDQFNQLIKDISKFFSKFNWFLRK